MRANSQKGERNTRKYLFVVNRIAFNNNLYIDLQPTHESIKLVLPIDYKILTPKDFVLRCADVIDAEGFEEVRVLEGPGDWKEDVHADEIIHSQSGVYEVLHFKVQCKHYANSGNPVSLGEVNEMFPYLFSTDANRLLIVTDTDLTTQAKQEINSFNVKYPIKKVIYWTKRELDNRLLRHRWILNKYFPVIPEVPANRAQPNFNPYKLLDSYKETDNEYFFGRDNDIRVLIEAVYRNRTVILFGESGVGKTSLLNAGLFPRLRQEGWLIVSTRCLDTPLENIEREAIAQIESLDRKIDVASLAQNGTFDSFLQHLSKLSDNLELRILVVIDQAEELFTLCDESDRNSLSLAISNSLNLTNAKGSLSFLFSLRDDYIGDLRVWTRGKVALDAVFSWDGLHSVGRFTVEEARLAIEEPLKRMSVSYDQSLLDHLLIDLQQLGNGFVYQPYLQIVCSTLFDECSKLADKDNFSINLDLYKKLDGAPGIIGSFFSEKLWGGLLRTNRSLREK